MRGVLEALKFEIEKLEGGVRAVRLSLEKLQYEEVVLRGLCEVENQLFFAMKYLNDVIEMLPKEEE
jgi:hypothetical protein